PPHYSSFLFNPAAPTSTYTLSLHDALPICRARGHGHRAHVEQIAEIGVDAHPRVDADGVGGHLVDARMHRRGWHHERVDTVQCGDRKSTRLNSSHVAISYAVFCLKKKTMSE